MTVQAKKEALARETQAKFPYLIHISHETLGDWYYCNADETIAYGGHQYRPCLFSIEQPEQTSSSIKNTKLSLSLVDTEGDNWIEKIRNSGGKRFSLEFAAVIVRYDGVNPVVEAVEENDFSLTEASWNELTVSWNVVFDENMQVLVPLDVAGSANVPGCA